MGARNLPRPETGIPASPAAIVEWLRYLCVSSKCRGLAGHELAACPELLFVPALPNSTRALSTQARADLLRAVLRQRFPLVEDGEHVPRNKAILALLGLTPSTYGQPRAVRRSAAARALGVAIDTFQKSYENDLLWDVAEQLWTE